MYFPEETEDSAPGYTFPKDAQKQMTRLLKERDLEGLNALLDEIYQKNLVEADLPAAEIRQMADELYWTIRKALRNAYDLSMTHVRMEPIRDAATIDEIFAYYRQVFAASLQEAETARRRRKGRKSLEEEICEYIGEHLYDPELSLNGIADQFGVSTKMIGLITRKRYGQTFLNYVRDRQIHHAAELLRETDLSLEEIAAQSGFTNILTFRRNFKAVMGVNPSEYRGWRTRESSKTEIPAHHDEPFAEKYKNRNQKRQARFDACLFCRFRIFFRRREKQKRNEKGPQERREYHDRSGERKGQPGKKTWAADHPGSPADADVPAGVSVLYHFLLSAHGGAGDGL